jgi:hypothetical protein
MELPDDSDLDVLILHQLDFILHVVGVSFSFDNIILVKSKTLSIWIVPFLASIFHFRVADPSFNYSGANQLNVSLIPFV